MMKAKMDTSKTARTRARFPRQRRTGRTMRRAQERATRSRTVTLAAGTATAVPGLKKARRIHGRAPSLSSPAPPVPEKTWRAPAWTRPNRTSAGRSAKTLSCLWRFRLTVRTSATATCITLDFPRVSQDSSFLITSGARTRSSCTPLSSMWGARSQIWPRAWGHYWQRCPREGWAPWTRPAWLHHRKVWRERQAYLSICSNTSWHRRWRCF